MNKSIIFIPWHTKRKDTKTRIQYCSYQRNIECTFLLCTTQFSIFNFYPNRGADNGWSAHANTQGSPRIIYILKRYFHNNNIWRRRFMVTINEILIVSHASFIEQCEMFGWNLLIFWAHVAIQPHLYPNRFLTD